MRVYPVVVGLLFIFFPFPAQADQAPQDDAGSGCDAGDGRSDAVPVGEGTYSGTITQDFDSDVGDAYLVSVDAAPAIIKVSVTATGDVELSLFDAHDGFRWITGMYDPELQAVAVPAGEWLFVVGFDDFEGGVHACQPAPVDEGDIVQYTFTVAIEPRDHVSVVDRPDASFRGVEVTMPEDAPALLEMHGHHTGPAEFEAVWVLAELPDGSDCAYEDWHTFGAGALPQAVVQAGPVRQRILGSVQAHGTYWQVEDSDVRSVRLAEGVSGSVGQTIYAAWDDAPSPFGLVLTDGQAYSLALDGSDGGVGVGSSVATAAVGAHLEFDLSGVWNSVSVRPPSGPAIVTDELVLTRPGSDPEVIEEPTAFEGASAPSGTWTLTTDAYAAQARPAPVVRAVGLPFEVPAGTPVCVS